MLKRGAEQKQLNRAAACPLITPPQHFVVLPQLHNWKIESIGRPANEVWIPTYHLYR